VPGHDKMQESFALLDSKAPKAYSAKWLQKDDVERLEDLKYAATRFYELPPETQGDFLVRFTYNTNAIEGNPLSLRQTALILNDGVSPQGARAQDVIEAFNGKDAWLCAKNYRKQPTAAFLRKLQYEVTKNTPCRIQGRFRDSEVKISGSNWLPPKPGQVPAFIESMLKEFKSGRKLHPIERAAWVHNKVAQIHPFTDGNGRTARLIMNWILMRNSFPPIVIDARNKEIYYKMLEMADKGDHKPFAKFLATQMLEQYTAKRQKV
ncbi:MAG TPA: Fic family protein, partial [Candidatus Micrarchaeota archaeon]|nr:Fic family protein [Candidatus Micrarchaeota archaeon]